MAQTLANVGMAELVIVLAIILLLLGGRRLSAYATKAKASADKLGRGAPKGSRKK